MAWDSHGVGELVGFIRSTDPAQSDATIFATLRALLTSWIERGWLDLGPSHRAGLGDVRELVPFLDQHGPAGVVALDSDLRLPEVDLTDRAFADVEWLRGKI
jgi:hypothetical protein